MIVQFLLFAVVLFLFLLARPGTQARHCSEDEMRRCKESPSETRRRHFLETGVNAAFWLGVIGLFLVAMSGFVTNST